MPEMNLIVKIKGGKRTPLAVFVNSMSVNKKTITLPDNTLLSSQKMERVIRNAIIRYADHYWNRRK